MSAWWWTIWRMTGEVDEVTNARLHAELLKQIGFLGRTAKLFDEGYENEGVRLAAVMRVLFHDTFHSKTGKPNSISLMTHLAMREGTMLATPPTQLADWRDFLAVKIDLNSATPSSLLPRLDLRLIEVPFSTWWDSDSVKAKASVSRRRLITNAANKDGGAHVDRKLERFYEELMHAKWSLGITGNLRYSGPPPFEQGVTQYPKNAHLALLRQFAYEVLATAERFQWS
jgi:hypothetical protein